MGSTFTTPADMIAHDGDGARLYLVDPWLSRLGWGPLLEPGGGMPHGSACLSLEDQRGHAMDRPPDAPPVRVHARFSLQPAQVVELRDWLNRLLERHAANLPVAAEPVAAKVGRILGPGPGRDDA